MLGINEFPFQSYEEVKSMKTEEILNYIFDKSMYQQIINYANYINQSKADIYILMARKSACFIRLLQDLNLVTLDGEVITDKRLDYDVESLEKKNVVIIDDIVVSGTSIHNVISKIRSVANSISVIVLGVNTKWFESDILEENGISYICAPYNRYTDSECMQICSNLVNCFALATIPYDVDFPVFPKIRISKNLFAQLTTFDDWLSFDVSSQMQAENATKSISLLPSTELISELSQEFGIDIDKYAFCKIRLFSRFTSKQKTSYIINAVPYFLINEIEDIEVNNLYSKLIGFEEDYLCETVKLRLLQFVFSAKLYLKWVERIEKVIHRKIGKEFDLQRFSLVFPIKVYDAVLQSINKPGVSLENKFKDGNIIDYTDEIKNLKITSKNSIASLQARLVEPFTNLYLNKEIAARKLVKEHKKDVFTNQEYLEKIDRLNQGYSYNFLRAILRNCTDQYNVDIIVSLFIDKAVDAGVIVPIIVYDKVKKILYRAYRHGEDVPFGEKEEKLCAIMLNEYRKIGGNKALSNLRLEKMLVLLLRIGLHQKLFTQFASNTQNEDILTYKGKLFYPKNCANISAYIWGDVVTIDKVNDKGDAVRNHYLENKTDAIWLSSILFDKGIVKEDKDSGDITVADNILLEIDKKEKSCAENIGQVFGYLYQVAKEKKKVESFDDMLTQLSTCLFPRDITSALAAEIAIFSAQWRILSSSKISEYILKENIDFIPKELMHKKLYASINSGQKKYIDFISKQPQNFISNINIELENAAKKNSLISPIQSLWESFWPSSIDWDEKSIPKDLLAIINREGSWILLMNYYLRVMLCLCSTGTDKDRYFNEVSLYKNKILKFAKLDSGNSIIKNIEKIVKLVNEQKLSSKNALERVYSKVQNLVDVADSILSESELIVNRFGQINKVLRFSNALYICDINHDDKWLREEINNGFDKIDSSTLRVISSRENRLKRGLLIVAQGQKCSRQQLFKLLNLVLETGEGRIFGSLFLDIPNESQIKCVSECNTDYKFGYFWDYVDLFDINSRTLCDSITIYFNLGKKDYVQYEDKEVAFLNNFYKTNTKKSITRKSLNLRKEYKISMNQYSNRKKHEVDILVVVATKEEEKAIINNIKGWKFKRTQRFDGYYMKEHHGLNFALVRGANMGTEDAAMAVQYFIDGLKPKVLSMVGFCAGRQGKVNLGDVFVASKTYNYEKGAQISSSEVMPEIDSLQLNDSLKLRIERFGNDFRNNIAVKTPQDFKLQCDTLILEFLNYGENSVELTKLYDASKYSLWTNIIEYLKGKEFITTLDNRWFSLTEEGKLYANSIILLHPDKKLGAPVLKTHVGVLATGNKVQKWDGIFEKLSQTCDRKTLAVDMEGHVMNKLGVANDITTIIVKGVGDFATSNKNFDNRFIEYACCAAYSFVEAFLIDNNSLFN